MSIPSFVLQILIWLPTILFGLTVVFHMIGGARRGLSKSFKLFITFLISILIALIFYLIMKKIDFNSKGVIWGNTILGWGNSNLTSLFNSMLSEGQTVSDHTTLIEYFSEFLSKSEFFKETSQGLTLEEAAKLLYSLALILINAVIFVLAILVFYVSKFILYIFYLIFFKEGRRRDRINKKYQDGKIDHEYKPHRFFGAIVGLVRGLMVGALIASFFGIPALLINNGSKEATIENKDEAIPADNYKNNIGIVMYETVAKWNNVGINKLLNQAKNADNVPFYVIVADQLLTTEYTYEVDGESKTITLHVSSDLAPISSAISSAAYLMIMYGYNPADFEGDKSGEKLANFLTSDKTIDGLTLEERINKLLAEAKTGEYTSYLMDKFVMSYVSKTCNVTDEKDPNYKELSLQNKLLYQLFLGNHKINASSLINDGNMAVAFDTFVDVVKHKSEIDAINKVLSTPNTTTTSRHLLYSVNAGTKKALEESENIVNYIYDDIQSLSFYNSESFNMLISDIISTVIETSIPDFDLTNVATEQTIYDIDWPSSIETVFTFLADTVSLILNNEFTSTEALTDAVIDSFRDSTKGIAKDLIDIADSSAGSVFLNSVGFNNLVGDALRKQLGSLLHDEDYQVVVTNYASYQKVVDGKTIKYDGELKKLINVCGPILADFVEISSDNTLTQEERQNQIVKTMTNDDSIKSLVNDSDENYSLLIHSIVSDIIKSLSFDNNGKVFSFYVPNRSLVIKNDLSNNEKSIIESEEFIKVFDFLTELNEKYTLNDFQNGDVSTIIDIFQDLVDYIKESNLILANVSRIIYTYKDSASLYIPSTLDIGEENLDANIDNWINEDGEMVKLLNIVSYKDSTGKSYIDIFKEVLSNNDTETSNNKIILDIVKDLSRDFIDRLCQSTILNGTLTNKLKTNEALFIPKDSYEIKNETLKMEEVYGLLNFARVALNITIESTSIDLNNLSANIDLSRYNGKLDQLLALFDSNIVAATISYNIVKSASGNDSNIVLPNEYIFQRTDETNLNNWIGTDKELDKLITAVYHLGLLASFNQGLNIDDSMILNLTDEKIDTVLNSTTVYASIVNYLIKNKPTGLYIPSSYDTNTDSIKHQYSNVLYVQNHEINKMMRGLKALSLNIRDTALTMDLVKSLNDIESGTKTKLDVILDSDVLYYTVSQYILSQDTNIDIPQTVRRTISFDEFISKEELSNLINALIILDVTDYSNINVDQLLTGEMNLDKMLESEIIHYTISNKILENSNIEVPTTSKETISNELYIKNNEIKSLVNSIKVLNISNIDSFSEDSLLSDNLDINTLLQSNIVWYTTSDKLLRLSTIDITSDVIYTDNGEYFIDKSELKNFINGVNVLTDTFDTIVVDASIVINNTSTLGKSSIIRNLVTNKILESEDIVMNRTKADVTENYAVKYKKYTESGLTETDVIQLEYTEFVNFANAVKIIYGDDSGSLTFDVDYSRVNILNLNQSILNSSIILYGLNPYIETAINQYNATASLHGKEMYSILSKFNADGHHYKIYDHTTKIEDIAAVISQEMTIDFIDNYLNA